MWISLILTLAVSLPTQKCVGLAATVKSFDNPILPGWHSDPTCTFVPELNNTFFCAMSSFIVTPGLPIYASHDLINWKLVSHALNRPEQWNGYRNTFVQNSGIYAPTLRYRNGIFYIITAYFSNTGITTLLFQSTDPFDNMAWGNPMNLTTIGYDPDLFWDDDDQAYLTTTPVNVAKIDLATGAIGAVTNVWNGTGGIYPEGPHMYKKDGYYYLMISEGGTELGHSVTIARSENITGPYESFVGNPILTNRNTSEYFQTVGHADIFRDAAGSFWASALSTRSGPAWINYPMGRETVLTRVTWEQHQWPVFEQIRGQIKARQLPPRSRKVAGQGPFAGDPDVINFESGSRLPRNFLFWRWPANDSFEISPPGHPNTLRMKPTGQITSVDNTAVGVDGITLVMRLQTDTEFTFSADVLFQPKFDGEEAGVTVFLTQEQHLDIGIVLLPSQSQGTLAIRLRTAGQGKYNGTLPIEIIKSVPVAWQRHPIMLQIQAVNDTHYAFAAASSANRSKLEVLGYAPAAIVSGGSGRFTGSLVGVYATNNNGSGNTPSYVSRWRYFGKGQKVD